MADMDFHLDTTALDRAMDLANEWSSSAPAYLVARTAQRIVSKTIKYTPSVSVGTIDAELDVAYAPGKTPGGKLSRQVSKARLLPGKDQNTERQDEPLAYLIQLARMAPGSNYNRLTNNRWRLPGGFTMLKGLDSVDRTAVLQQLAERMIKARHSSTHFLVSGWASAAKKLYNLLGSYIRGDSEAPPLEDGFSDKTVSPKPNMSDLRYSSGQEVAQVVVSNMIGMVDSSVNGSNADNYNKALLLHGIQPLQRAMDEVAEEMKEHYMAKDMKEMAAQFNAIR
jgi:hypothetical protein